MVFLTASSQINLQVDPYIHLAGARKSYILEEKRNKYNCLRIDCVYSDLFNH